MRGGETRRASWEGEQVRKLLPPNRSLSSYHVMLDLLRQCLLDGAIHWLYLRLEVSMLGELIDMDSWDSDIPPSTRAFPSSFSSLLHSPLTQSNQWIEYYSKQCKWPVEGATR